MNKQNQTDFPENPQLLIVGASTRAAAFSALRAGFRPVCVDQYADQDLLEIAEVIPKTAVCSDWIETLLQRSPLEWIYTGAMENQPEFIEQISQKHLLRGCDSEVLERVRNPFLLEQILSQSKIRAAPCLPAGSLFSETEKWLSKPFKGAAGAGIQFAGSHSSTHSIQENCYLQRYEPGIPLSALFISFQQATVLVGVSLQFIGNSAFHAGPFQFCGGVTLSPVTSWLKESLEKTGQTISQHCQIQGIFGCDFLLNPEQENEIWLNEVNPRYTALTELFELQYRLPLLHWHLAACRSFDETQTGKNALKQLQSELLQSEKGRNPLISKGILYAASKVKTPKTGWNSFCTDHLYQIPESADIPCSETIIAPGSPICTVFGVGENLQSCLQSLAERVVHYEQIFEQDSCQSRQHSEVFNTFVPLNKIENLFFQGFSPSRNESHSFLED
ncbi:MAG: ATP-grasp domain-containing protein [Planctomycetes bacterium]|nr:ATP-grasp domain-containing protein [Planctomycetota bacterium]MCH9724293.1 ATP-grasp domain-containing protein [Planctomycetota bacterium]MCH9777312.1 ATP-grasp domain-containing protein [Planctomycetota bacterium]MCH9792996.1 ATP-grasp domain-containing protein [Planctomycetota bacterium]